MIDDAESQIHKATYNTGRLGRAFITGVYASTILPLLNYMVKDIIPFIIELKKIKN